MKAFSFSFWVNNNFGWQKEGNKSEKIPLCLHWNQTDLNQFKNEKTKKYSVNVWIQKMGALKDKKNQWLMGHTAIFYFKNKLFQWMIEFFAC